MLVGSRDIWPTQELAEPEFGRWELPDAGIGPIRARRHRSHRTSPAGPAAPPSAPSEHERSAYERGPVPASGWRPAAARRRRAGPAPGAALGPRPRRRLGDLGDLARAVHAGLAAIWGQPRPAQRPRPAGCRSPCCRTRSTAGPARRASPAIEPAPIGWPGGPACEVDAAARTMQAGRAASVTVSADRGRRLAGARDDAHPRRATACCEWQARSPTSGDADSANGAHPAYDVAALRALLPLPPRATEVLDLTGRWCRERSPQRRILGHGTHLRASRRGRTGHDATLLLVAGTPGFTTRRGEVWGAHVAWSGDHEHLVERLPEGAGMHAGVIGGGELLRPGEVRLGAGRDVRRARRVLRLVRRRARRPGGPAARAPAGASRPTRAARARSCSTPGRRATSTWTWTGCARSPTTAASVGRRAVRHRRRLVPRPARRHRRAGGLVRRRGAVPGWAAPDRGSRSGTGDAARTVGRAGDGQPRLRPDPRAPVLAARRRHRRRLQWTAGRRRSGGASTCSTSPSPRSRRTCWSGSTRWSPSTPSTS